MTQQVPILVQTGVVNPPLNLPFGLRFPLNYVGECCQILAFWQFERSSVEQSPDEFCELEQESPISASKFQLTVTLGIVFLVLLGVDVMLPFWFNSESGLLALNVVVAQLTLICIWGTLVEGTFWVRIPWTLLMLVISWGAIAWGVQLESQAPAKSSTIVAIGIVWFYGFVISFIPLKFAASLFGWRITHAVERTNAPSQNRYAIRDVMIGTALLAMVLAIGRAWLPGDPPAWSSVVKESGFHQPEMFLVMGIFSVVSLAVKLPCIWIALAMERDFFRFSTYWVIASGGLGLVEYFMFCVVVGTSGSPWEFVFYLVMGHMCMAIVMLVVLRILRNYGYSMSRIRKGDQPKS